MKLARFLLAVLIVACRHGRPDSVDGFGQPLTPIGALPTDSAVLARLERANPCAPHLPPIGHHSDSLTSTARCTLVATAVATIRDSAGDPSIIPILRQFRLEQVRCIDVRGEAYRNEATHEMDLPRWSIEFYSDHQPALAVEVNRLTGVARAYRVLEEFGFTAADICGKGA